MLKIKFLCVCLELFALISCHAKHLHFNAEKNNAIKITRTNFLFCVCACNLFMR